MCRTRASGRSLRHIDQDADRASKNKLEAATPEPTAKAGGPARELGSTAALQLKYRKQPHAKYRVIDALSDPGKTF
jgi:hypothetical protein